MMYHTIMLSFFLLFLDSITKRKRQDSSETHLICIFFFLQHLLRQIYNICFKVSRIESSITPNMLCFFVWLYCLGIQIQHINR